MKTCKACGKEFLYDSTCYYSHTHSKGYCSVDCHFNEKEIKEARELFTFLINTVGEEKAKAMSKWAYTMDWS